MGERSMLLCDMLQDGLADAEPLSPPKRERSHHDARGRRGSFDEQPQRQQRIRTASLDELPASEAAAALDALAA